MKRKHKTPVEHYQSICIRVQEFSAARLEASVNYEAREPRHQDDYVRVYRFESSLELQCPCTYPEDRSGECYRITVHGRQSGHGYLESRLADYHIRDKNGLPKYRKRRGHEVPIYHIPNELGLLEKERDREIWSGWMWVPEQPVRQMLTLVATG